MTDGTGRVIDSRDQPPTWSGTSRSLGLLRAARPSQWVKNCACFAGLVFSGKLFDPKAVVGALLAFVGFSLAASACYLMNDVFDREADRRNPKKRGRAIAAGLVSVRLALGTSALLLVGSMFVTLALPWSCRFILAIYALMSLAYSYRLKQSVLLDVQILAIGFVLRVLHGVYAVEVLPSPWIVLCMFFLALFLGFAKRRGELNETEGEDFSRRPVLGKYRIAILDQFLAMSAVMAILCYALYTVIGRPGNATLVVTVPLVVYAMFRYLFLIVVHGAGEAPERLVISDGVSFAIVVLWLTLCVAILYFNLNLFIDH